MFQVLAVFTELGESSLSLRAPATQNNNLKLTSLKRAIYIFNYTLFHFQLFVPALIYSP